MTTQIVANWVAINAPGDSLKWSPECGGCLMWMRDGRDWSSQDEGEFHTPACAEYVLGWYEQHGVRVDWTSLDDHAVVNRGPS